MQMYSGTTLRQLKYFDAWFGAHQKIDRVARRHLEKIMPDAPFPTRKEILKFEGLDGPDGIKRKATAQGEPKHFFDPENAASGSDLLATINSHYRQLVGALQNGNKTRASFEAAWLAHAVVDGLTPAHHYPYEKEIVRLRGGLTDEDVSGAAEKLIMAGDSLAEKLSNNWQMWGDRGLLAMHLAFEWGIAIMILPLRLTRALPSDDELVRKQTIEQLFTERAKSVNDLQLYEKFHEAGWTPKLSKVVRRQLMPTIVNTVTLIWYWAAQEARA